MPPSPTYYVTKDTNDQDIYNCLYCEQSGAEHHATDLELFTKHMEQRHDGRMLEGPEEAARAGEAEDEPAPMSPPSALPPGVSPASVSPDEGDHQHMPMPGSQEPGATSGEG